MTLAQTLQQLEAAGSAQAVAEAMAAKWRKDEREFVAVAGWDIVAELANNSSVPDAKFAALLKTIERDIHSALIGIGVRNAKLEKLAVAAAKRA